MCVFSFPEGIPGLGRLSAPNGLPFFGSWLCCLPAVTSLLMPSHFANPLRMKKRFSFFDLRFNALCSFSLLAGLPHALWCESAQE